MSNINWINVSGGKDSTALLLWSLEEGLPNCRYVYADTQWEHPAVYEYLEYLERETGVAIDRVQSEGMEAMCLRKGLCPSRARKFCTEELKVVPLAKHMDEAEDSSQDNPHCVWVGIRWEESPARARLTETTLGKVNYPPRKVSWQLRHHPLLDWVTADVFDIHKRHGIEPNPLYKMGMGRVGCFPCIMAGQKELKKLFKVSPETIDKVEALEDAINAKTGKQDASWIAGDKLPNGVPLGIRAYAEYLDDGDEFPGMEQDIQGCMSIYGLCE